MAKATAGPGQTERCFVILDVLFKHIMHGMSNKEIVEATGCTMVEEGKNVIAAVFFDTGWEFPQMYEHLEQLDEWLMEHVGLL